MALSAFSNLFSPLSHHSLLCWRPSSVRFPFFPLFHGKWYPKSYKFSPPAIDRHHSVVAYCGGKDGVGTESSVSCSLGVNLLRQILGAKDPKEALEMITETKMDYFIGTMENNDCHSIVVAALDQVNVELALSVFDAMYSHRAQGMNEVRAGYGLRRMCRPVPY